MLIWTLLQVTALVCMYMTGAYALAQIKKNNGIADIAWAGGFVLVAIYTLVDTKLFFARHILVTALILIWGIRLSTHIALRNWNAHEDARYAHMRQQWAGGVAWRSFVYIFLLQGVFILIISYPVILINCSAEYGLTFLDYIGLSIWLIGFIFEAVGDYQLTQFLKKPENKGMIMTQGLWRYTRHPNYFGEATMWWGIFLIALSVPHGISAIISPLCITFLLRCVSGVPLTEKQLAHMPAYQAYKKHTNTFLPWFYRS